MSMLIIVNKNPNAVIFKPLIIYLKNDDQKQKMLVARKKQADVESARVMSTAGVSKSGASNLVYIILFALVPRTYFTLKLNAII